MSFRIGTDFEAIANAGIMASMAYNIHSSTFDNCLPGELEGYAIRDFAISAEDAEKKYSDICCATFLLSSEGYGRHELLHVDFTYSTNRADGLILCEAINGMDK